MTATLIASATVAVSFDGEIQVASGYGDWPPDKQYPVASLSKAITGVCVAKLIDAGKLNLSDTVGKILAAYFKIHPAPSDARVLDITVEELLTHRSGLKKNTFGDTHSITGAIESTLASSLKFNPGTAFSYGDSGYLLLGFLADQANGQAYLETCLPILSAVKAGGLIDATMRERAPNGGWDISANSYIRFLQYFLKGTTHLSPQMEAF